MPSTVNSHKVYGGATAGSLTNVGVNVSYSDGSKTGGGGRAYEASEPLLDSDSGRAALAAYLKSKKKGAKGMLKYTSAELRLHLGLPAS